MSNTEMAAEKATGNDETPDAVPDGRIKIHLTAHPPVRVRESDWPILAQAVMPLYRIDPRQTELNLFNAVKASLEAPEEINDDDPGNVWPEQVPYVHILCRVQLTVRRHADGRILLYGLRRTPDAQENSLADELGGELLASDKALKDALMKNANVFIAMCGGCCEDAPRKLAEAVLSQLPPKNLDIDGTAKADSGVIVLNGGTPVQLSRTEWPLIAEAKTPLIYAPFSCQGEWDGCTQPYGYERLAVRQRHDGEAVVYGELLYEDEWAAQFNMFNPRGGELVSAGKDLAAAIKRVGTELGLCDETIRACVNGLPAQDLD
ncbi:MAG: hypothetical protein PHV28_17945 [Kiritimatiellae bacterium]|nr:hypothetical protein [Kiritimatiellia bacterium]